MDYDKILYSMKESIEKLKSEEKDKDGIWCEKLNMYEEYTRIYEEKAKIAAEQSKLYSEKSALYSEKAQLASDQEKVFLDRLNISESLARFYRYNEKSSGNGGNYKSLQDL